LNSRGGWEMPQLSATPLPPTGAHGRYQLYTPLNTFQINNYTYKINALFYHLTMSLDMGKQKKIIILSS